MWLTILNREKGDNNLFKKAFKKIIECENGDTLILGYGYIGSVEQIKKQLGNNIFEQIASKNLKKIIIIGTNMQPKDKCKHGNEQYKCKMCTTIYKENCEKEMDVYVEWAKEFEKYNKNIHIRVLAEKRNHYHSKVAIKYSHDKQPNIAVIGSSNLTKPALYELKESSSTENYFQKETDILLGQYDEISDLSSDNVSDDYKKILGEIGDPKLMAACKVLGETYVSHSIELMLRNLIDEVEERWKDNYNIKYMSKAHIESLSDKKILELLKSINTCKDLRPILRASYDIPTVLYDISKENNIEKLKDLLFKYYQLCNEYCKNNRRFFDLYKKTFETEIGKFVKKEDIINYLEGGKCDHNGPVKTLVSNYMYENLITALRK